MITSGLVFYAPLWKHRTNKSPFLSEDDYEHSCTVTGAVWGSQGRTFDGDDKINAGNAVSLQQASTLTARIVVKFNTIDGVHSLLNKGENAEAGTFWLYYNVTGTALYLELDETDAIYTWTPVIGVFYDIVVSYDGDKSRIYIDGVNVYTSASIPGKQLNDTTNSFMIGEYRNAGVYFLKGVVGEVMFYKNRVLSAAEVLQTYNETKYEVVSDWDKDGDFSDTYDDITSDIKSIHYSRGKSDELGKAEVGQCSISLNNASAKYTPGAGGVISTLLKPKRPLGIRAYQYAINYDLFYGFIEEIIPHPHLTEQDCIITAVDGLDFLSRHDMATALYKNALTGAIHGYILDDAGWSATMRTLDAGQTTVPYWYGADVKARFAQEELDDNEQGFSYVDGAGYFRFEDRHHRSTSTHQTPQGTFNNTMAQITYSLNPKNVYNIVKVTVTPWAIQAITTLWTLQETPIIPVGETYTYWGEASVSGTPVFVDAWTTPDATDYTATPDTVSIVTTKFAKTIKLAVTNTGIAPVTLSLLRARGTYYDDQTKVTRKAEDTTSQTAYQKRTLVIDGKYMTSANTAQSLANYAIGKFKDPRAELSMSIMNRNSTMLTQILSREISDRITVVNTLLGVNGDYFIDYMEHSIEQGGLLHTATYRLASCSNEDFWCLGYSKLGTQTKLGF